MGLIWNTCFPTVSFMLEDAMTICCHTITRKKEYALLKLSTNIFDKFCHGYSTFKKIKTLASFRYHVLYISLLVCS